MSVYLILYYEFELKFSTRKFYDVLLVGFYNAEISLRTNGNNSNVAYETK